MIRSEVRVYWRLGRRIGVSMPWWLALPIALLWLTGFLLVVAYVAIVWLIGHGIQALWRLSTKSSAGSATRP